MANDNLVRAMKSTDAGGNRHSRISPVRLTEQSKRNAIISKYIRNMYGAADDGRGELQGPAQASLMMASKTAQNVIDSESMLQLLPDMELAMQVLISSVLSPNDMMSTRLGYRTANDELGEVTPLLTEVAQNYFDNVYKINTKLPVWLKAMLFSRGANPIAVIPEAAIDALINGDQRVSLESFNAHYDHTGQKSMGTGMLGPADDNAGFAWGLESFARTDFSAIDSRVMIPKPNSTAEEKIDLGIRITDNISLLKIPQLHRRMVADRTRDIYSSSNIAMESALNPKTDVKEKRLTEREVDSLLSSAGQRQFQHSPVVSIKTLKELDRETVGHPMILNLPTEAVIPIHVPSAPDQHIGYFVLVDQYGNPVRADLSNNFYNDMAANTSAIKDMSSMLLSQTRRAQEGSPDRLDNRLIEEMQLAFNQIMERQLRNRLKNGAHGENVEVADLEAVNRVMFARCIARKTTQLIYIPSTLMTYMAIQYNDYGVGESLLEATKIIGALRALLMFANTMGAVKNSITHTDLNIELDPTDPDPQATIDYLMHVHARTRSSSFPIAAPNPQDLINYLQNAGTQVNISNHPGMPTTKSSVEQRQTNHVQVNSDLEDNLKKRQLMATYVPPETVDLSMSVDFAKSVISSNLLLAKRAMVIQERFCELIAEFMRKFMFNSKKLMDDLRKVVDDNKSKIPAMRDNRYSVDDIVLYFINVFEVYLPEPEISRLEVQKETFDKYNEFLDVALDAYISDQIIDTNIYGELANNIGLCRNVLKAAAQRQFMASNNILPELAKMFAASDTDEIGFDLLKTHNSYMEGFSKALFPFLQKAMGAKAENDKKVQEMMDKLNVEPPSGDTGGGEGGTEGGGEGDGGGEGGGEGGEFNFEETGNDVGGDGETVEKTDEEPEAGAEEKPKDEDNPEETEEKPEDTEKKDEEEK